MELKMNKTNKREESNVLEPENVILRKLVNHLLGPGENIFESKLFFVLLTIPLVFLQQSNSKACPKKTR